MNQRNSGYVATGHLLAGKEPDTHFATLRHFCTLIFCNLDEDDIHKSSGFWRYDQFFRSVEVGVESFAKFVGGILRKHETNEFELQLLVERLAWDLVKYDFDHLNCPKITRKGVLFRLFCVFNRLCNAKTLPMVMPAKAARLILREVGIPAQNTSDKLNQDITLPEFFRLVCDNKDEVSVKGVKRVYDELVRDVIKEDRVKYKSPAGGGQEKHRTFTVTSRHLVVREDIEGTDALDQPRVTEPTGKVLYRLPLVELETRVAKGGLLSGGSNKMFLQVLTPKEKKNGGGRKRSTALEMVFDASKDQLEMYSWSQAIQEGVYATQANSSRLDKLYHRLGMGAEQSRVSLAPPSQTQDGRRRISAPESPPGFKPEVPETQKPGSSNYLGVGSPRGDTSASSSPGAIRPRAATRSGVFNFEQLGRSMSEAELRVTRHPSSCSSSSNASSVENVINGDIKYSKRRTSTTVINVTSDEEGGVKISQEQRRQRKKGKNHHHNNQVGIELISSQDNVTTVVVKPGRKTSGAVATKLSKVGKSPSRPLSELPKSFTTRVSSVSSNMSSDSLEEESIKEDKKSNNEEDGLWIKEKNESPKIARAP